MRDTPMGRFSFTQMAGISELIGEKIVDDSKRGRREALEEGRIVNTTPKYGYVYIPKGQPGGGRFEIDPAKAEMVRQAARWYVYEGLSFYAIAKRLNEAGIPSQGYRGGKGNKGSQGKPPGLWSAAVVRQMLLSRTYIGEHVCGGVTVKIPPILDREIFDAIQRRAKENRERLVGRPTKKVLFVRFLYCQKCGRRMITNPGFRRGYKPRPCYRCGNIEYKPYRKLCHAPQIFADVLDEAGWKPIWKLATDPEDLWAQGNAYNDRQRKPGESQKLNAELDRLRRQQGNIVKLIRRGRLDADEGEKDLKALDPRIAEREQKLAALGKVVELPPLEVLKKQMAEIYDPRDEPKTYEERRLVLEGLRDLRLDYYDGELEITGKVPVCAASGQKNRHRSVRSDAEREREHHSRGEARVLAERPKSVAKIL